MKLFFILCMLTFPTISFCQSPGQQIVEGSKTLVELIKVIKTPRQNLTAQNFTPANNNAADSCVLKQRSDLCYKNNSSKVLTISIYKRNGDVYDTLPFTMKVLAQKQECWYELWAGIYKYKIEQDATTGKTILSEGEFKLEACENMVREISE